MTERRRWLWRNTRRRILRKASRVALVKRIPRDFIYGSGSINDSWVILPIGRIIDSALYSCCAFQVDWFSADHEEQCIQGHRRAQVPSSDYVSAATVGYEERRFLGKPTLSACSSVKLGGKPKWKRHGTPCAEYMDSSSLRISTLPLHRLPMTLSEACINLLVQKDIW